MVGGFMETVAVMEVFTKGATVMRVEELAGLRAEVSFGAVVDVGTEDSSSVDMDTEDSSGTVVGLLFDTDSLRPTPGPMEKIGGRVGPAPADIAAEIGAPVITAAPPAMTADGGVLGRVSSSTLAQSYKSAGSA